MTTYIVRLHHDNGFTDLKIRARSVDAAKLMVLKAENCPEKAISMIVPLSIYNSNIKAA